MATKRNQNLMQLIKKVHGYVENTDLEKHRQSQNQVGSILSDNRNVEYSDADIEGLHGEWVRVRGARRKHHVILYCHGGGYSTGSCVYGRTLTAKLARTTSIDVLSFDYRLAPENPYPAAVEDAMKAWNYLMLLGYGAGDVIVAGDSAGGNLALVLVHCLKQEKRQIPAGLVLLSPWTDLTSSGESFQERAQLDPVLSAEYIERMIQAYAPGEDLTNPLISPLLGDLKDFPPCYIQVGENEILFSDAQRLCEKLKEAGGRARLDVFKGMWHVFQMSPFKTAYEAMDRCAEFIFDICH